MKKTKETLKLHEDFLIRLKNKMLFKLRKLC